MTRRREPGWDAMAYVLSRRESRQKEAKSAPRLDLKLPEVRRAFESIEAQVARARKEGRRAQPGDRVMADIQQAYDEVRRQTGKAPSQRAVARRTGYARETVTKRWPKVRK